MTKDGLTDFLRADAFKELDNIETDQQKDLPQPAVQKSCPSSSVLISLTPVEDFNCGDMNILDILKNRKTRRIFSKDSITIEELSFLLWSVQGVKK